MRDELRDRFGDVPDSVDNLLRVALMRVKAHSLYMREVKGGNGEITFEILREAKLKSENIPLLLKHYKGSLSFKSKGKVMFIYTYKKDENSGSFKLFGSGVLLCAAAVLVCTGQQNLWAVLSIGNRFSAHIENATVK